jgi:hypothetical protein
VNESVSYSAAGSYEEIRWRAVKAVLESRLNIEIEEMAGQLTIYQDHRKVATVDIAAEKSA